MKKYFHLSILTPNQLVFEGKVLSLNCETTEGWYGVLPDHCAAIVALVPSVIKFEDIDEKEHQLNTEGGILKIRKNEAVILVETSSECTVSKE